MSYTTEELSVKFDYMEKDIEGLKREVKDFSEVKVQLKMLGQTVDTLGQTVGNLAATVREDNRQVNENINQLTKAIEFQSKASKENEERCIEFQNNMENRLHQLEEKEANDALKSSQEIKKRVIDYIIKAIVCLLLLGTSVWISGKANANTNKTDNPAVVKEYNAQHDLK